MVIKKKLRPRRVDAQQSAAQILASAERVLDEDANASLLKIAAAAGLTRVTIYRHFKSREELLETLLCKVYQDAIAVIQQVNASGVTFVPALGALTMDFLKNARRLRVIANTPRSSKKVVLLRTQMHELIERLLHQGMTEGSVDPALDLVWVRFTYFSLIRQARVREKELGYDLGQLHGLIVRTFLSGASKTA